MKRPYRPYVAAEGKRVFYYDEKINCLIMEFHNDLKWQKLTKQGKFSLVEFKNQASKMKGLEEMDPTSVDSTSVNGDVTEQTL